MPSPYEVLGVAPDADEETVERAYREKIKEAHPDHGGSQSAFRHVRGAYQAILNGNAAVGTEASGTDATVEQPPEERSTRVEYLNFEVLADYGWAVTDEDLFERAAAADLDPRDYGEFDVRPDEFLLEAAEKRGHTWPFACRGGACANCAVLVTHGELAQPVDHILPSELLDRDIRLSCLGEPVTDELRVVFNVKHLPELEELRLPPGPFERVEADD